MDLLKTIAAVRSLVPPDVDVDYVAHRRSEDEGAGHWSVMVSRGGEWAEGKFPLSAKRAQVAVLALAMLREIETPGVAYAEPFTLKNVADRDFAPLKVEEGDRT